MKIRAILQARLNSSRLPAKMLLPVGGMSLITLCAKRAANCGLDVTVAISDEDTDDLLAAELENHDIHYIRGPLDNVLGRFLKAAQNMNDDDIIVRLTGDNPVVDGIFIKELIDFHRKHGENYTRTLSPQDGLPYGVSAEVFNLGALRRVADRSDLTASDREHVTAYWTKNDQFQLYRSPLRDDFSHIRVTVDTFDDYVRIAQLFETIDNPITVTWQDLIDTLNRTSSKPADGLRKLALGTVQLGLPYGIANATGQPDENHAKAILTHAVSNGIKILDTAAAYGTSETIIGKSLSSDALQNVFLQTKIPPLDHICEDAKTSELEDAITSAFYRSLYRLQLQSLSCLMFHRWADCKKLNGHGLKVAENFISEGLIAEVGVSVSSPKEALEALNTPIIKRIQIPMNILDTRWEDTGFSQAALKRPDVHVQARSSLLQGVFTLPAGDWPFISTQEAEANVQFLNDAATKFGRESVIDLCYAYLRSLNWIDSIVVGAETLAQIDENTRLFAKAVLKADEVNAISRPKLDHNFLNPANWPKG